MNMADMPLFQLADQGTLQLWQQREMLVAVLHGDGCAPCADARRALHAGEDSWSHEHIGVVAIELPEPDHPRDDQVARVADALFEALAPLGVTPGEPCIAVSDRYGQTYAAVKVHGRATEEVIADALGWIDFVQEQCDECGAPVEWTP